VSLHRFFVEQALGDDTVVVTGDDLHHLRDVLRLAPGDEIAVAGRDGRQGVARLTHVGRDEAVAEVLRELPTAFDPDVTLIQGLSRGPKMDLVMQKVTEVGVRRIAPVVMRRSVVKLDPGERAGRADRWRKIVAEAAKQSQRATLPEVDEPVESARIADALAGLDVVLVPWEESAGCGIGDALRQAGATAASRVGVVIGPEGGMEAAEVERLVELGAVPVTLGPTILRTETAAIVAVALVSYELGGLGGAARE
jgi:16S rRNA (uracil1498-N3)-methyltransferase